MNGIEFFGGSLILAAIIGTILCVAAGGIYDELHSGEENAREAVKSIVKTWICIASIFIIVGLFFIFGENLLQIIQNHYKS